MKASERIIWTIINGRSKFFLRVWQAAQLLVNVTQVVVSLGIIRVNLQGALVCFFCLIEMFLHVKQNSVVVPSIRSAVVQSRSRFEMLLGLLRITSPGIERYEIHMRLHVTGIVGQRGFVLANRLVEQGGFFQF